MCGYLPFHCRSTSSVLLVEHVTLGCLRGRALDVVRTRARNSPGSRVKKECFSLEYADRFDRCVSWFSPCFSSPGELSLVKKLLLCPAGGTSRLLDIPELSVSTLTDRRESTLACAHASSESLVCREKRAGHGDDETRVHCLFQSPCTTNSETLGPLADKRGCGLAWDSAPSHLCR